MFLSWIQKIILSDHIPLCFSYYVVDCSLLELRKLWYCYKTYSLSCNYRLYFCSTVVLSVLRILSCLCTLQSHGQDIIMHSHRLWQIIQYVGCSQFRQTLPSLMTLCRMWLVFLQWSEKDMPSSLVQCLDKAKQTKQKHTKQNTWLGEEGENLSPC
jgi:hypothetical protein